MVPSVVSDLSMDSGPASRSVAFMARESGYAKTMPTASSSFLASNSRDGGTGLKNPGRSGTKVAPAGHQANLIVQSQDDFSSTSSSAVVLKNTYLQQQNQELRDELEHKDREIGSLREEIEQLKSRVEELRQLPTGKISQIPIE